MSGTGRVARGGADAGAGVAVGPRLVVTANHVIRGCGAEEVVFRPSDGGEIGVQRIVSDEEIDGAVLHLADDLPEWLPPGRGVEGGGWRADSPPPGNDPRLTGRITGIRVPIVSATGHPVRVLQLLVDQELADYRGYSGSGVLDTLGRTVVGVLVEQTHLRIPIGPGEARRAANVLYALPIADAAERLGIDVRTASPARLVVPRRAGTVDRGALLDRLVARLTSPETTPGSVVEIMGYGGMGKTILAEQAGHDPRVWQRFPGGIVMMTAGERESGTELRERLRSLVAPPGVSLADALAGDDGLLIVDDVWSSELLYGLVAGLPDGLTLAVTTRGVALDELSLGRKVSRFHVPKMLRDEAIRLLARGGPRSTDLDAALDELARTLGYWALLLDMAATELHADEVYDDLDADDLDADTLEDDHDLEPRRSSSDLLVKARALAEELAADPTTLNDRERSFDTMLDRSLARLGDERTRAEERTAFFQLALYPPDAELRGQVLADLWQVDGIDVTRRVRRLRQVGLVSVVRRSPLPLRMHDFIVGWLHREHGAPDDPRHHAAHRRCVALAMNEDGTPGDLTPERAEWLGFHLLRTGDAEDPARLLGPSWWAAFRRATGTAAAYLEALRRIAADVDAPRARDPGGALAPAQAQAHLLSTAVLHAYLSARVGQAPVTALVTQALLGQGEAALREAASNPDPGAAAEAVGRIVLKMAERGMVDRTVRELAVDLVMGLREARPRAIGLARVAEAVATIDPGQARLLLERASGETGSIGDEADRSDAVTTIALELVRHDWPRAADLALTIDDAWLQRRALADITARVAADDVDQAVAVAGRAHPFAREDVLEAIARTVAARDPERAVEIARPGAIWGRGVADMVAAVAREDPDKALAMVPWIDFSWEQQRALTSIAAVVAETDPDRAMELLRSAGNDYLDTLWGIGRVAEAMVPLDPDRAVELAASIPTRTVSNQTLAAIARAVAARDPVKAITIARRITNAPARDEAVAVVVGALALSDPTEADTVASGINAKAWRSRALADVAAAIRPLHPEQADDLVRRALETADRISHKVSRDEVLASVATTLVASDPARAVQVAETIHDDGRRSGILTDLALAVMTTEPDQAITIAGGIPDPRAKREAMAGLAAVAWTVDPALAGALVDRIAELSTVLPRDPARDEALVSLAVVLAGTDPDRALAVAGTVQDRPASLRAVGCIAARIWVTDTARARALADLAEAEAGGSGGAGGSEALAGIGSALWACDEERGRRLFTWAVEVARRIPGRVASGEAQARVAVHLAQHDVEEAVELALGIAAVAPRSEALANVLSLLAGHDPQRALALAEAVPRKEERRTALATVKRAVPDGVAALARTDPDRAVAIAEGLPNDGTRNRALAAVARAVAPTDLDRALALSQWSTRAARGRVLAGIARGLAATDPDRALAIADRLPPDGARVQVLVDLAAATRERDPEHAEVLIGRAVETTEALRATASWEELEQIATVLVADDPGRAMTIAAGIPDPYAQVEVLGCLAAELRQGNAVLDAPVIEQAIQLLQSILAEPTDRRIWEDHRASGKEIGTAATVLGYFVGLREPPRDLVPALSTVWWKPADAMRFMGGFLVALEERSPEESAVAAAAIVDVIVRFSSPG